VSVRLLYQLAAALGAEPSNLLPPDAPASQGVGRSADLIDRLPSTARAEAEGILSSLTDADREWILKVVQAQAHLAKREADATD